ncbi:3-methyl-2-oxobutanoate hydroxymethyltransferase [Paraburkholderia sp. Ac-20340]|uniref:3-methyl-2-oxobutanoate hydroxymethyltransferase n=1 Tax=Paraburkholderia sp. Ac-20340 TaxID=2703888 RepID=UPI0019811653|nr:3-methyl-2-oxobutanoate hydroxymethyltransferase [Paraburkholderia sp. Ac-20340]MBN3858566.1 3-methyl-2-oxobutanoate hydroxymethyltransferase [Paraburkholderia sp. Ac-20340]
MQYLHDPAHPQVTVTRLQSMREADEKIAMLTCYDATFAALMDRAGVDIAFIGDSLGNVVQGHTTTLPVSVADIAYHTAAVTRGVRRAMVISDIPFGCLGSVEQTYDAAVELMRAGASMVKIEGGHWLSSTIRFLVERGIPVCAHIGLTPQSVHAFGGFKVQGKSAASATVLLNDAAACEAAGAQLLVIEAIPSHLAAEVTGQLSIPTIGIGAGPYCSGQVLVLHDMLGISPGKRPRFVKDFMEGESSILAGLEKFVREVKEGVFPGSDHSYQ